MSKPSELEDRAIETLNQFCITPSGESILAQLGIEPTAIKTIKPPSKRNKYRAVVNWLMKYKHGSPDFRQVSSSDRISSTTSDDRSPNWRSSGRRCSS